MIVIGAGGHAKVICSIIEATGQNVDAIFDDDDSIHTLNEYKVLGPYQSNFKADKEVIIAVGKNVTRSQISLKVKHAFGKLIHPSAIIDERVMVDFGTVVLQGAIIQRDSQIGRHCIVNTSSSIDHDCTIEDFVHISPSATLCGNVKVGYGSLIGAGATIIPCVKIGKWCTIGAGSVITTSIPDYSVVVGVPGKIIKVKNDEFS